MIINKATLPCFICSMAFALTACVGNTPAPETDPQPEPANTTDAQQPAGTADSQETAEQNDVYFNSQALDNHRLATPENIPTVPEQSTPTSAEKTDSVITDPYTTIPALI